MLLEIRGTTLGALVLGFGFKVSDFLCYVAGITVVAFANQMLCRWFASRYN